VKTHLLGGLAATAMFCVPGGAAFADSSPVLGGLAIFGNGTIRTWATFDEAGAPLVVGITFTDTGLSGLPAHQPSIPMDAYPYKLSMPKGTEATGIDHVEVDWNPVGHIPAGVYDVPHFDFHFHFTSEKELSKITIDPQGIKMCQNKPAPANFPQNYIYAPGGEVPGMGAHWVDVTSPELHGSPFTHTFIFGSYNGKVNFIEPMIAKSFLESKANAEAPIKQPSMYPKGCKYFPTKYTISYNADRHEHTIALEGFVKH
jgi:hypothetical protein